jgi:hypothetical protein
VLIEIETIKNSKQRAASLSSLDSTSNNTSLSSTSIDTLTESTSNTTSDNKSNKKRIANQRKRTFFLNSQQDQTPPKLVLDKPPSSQAVIQDIVDHTVVTEQKQEQPDQPCHKRIHLEAEFNVADKSATGNLVKFLRQLDTYARASASKLVNSSNSRISDSARQTPITARSESNPAHTQKKLKTCTNCKRKAQQQQQQQNLPLTTCISVDCKGLSEQKRAASCSNHPSCGGDMVDLNGSVVVGVTGKRGEVYVRNSRLNERYFPPVSSTTTTTTTPATTTNTTMNSVNNNTIDYTNAAAVDSSSFATAIGQGPVTPIKANGRYHLLGQQPAEQSGGYFAQAIGQGATTRHFSKTPPPLSRTDKAQRILEIHSGPCSSGKKRLRSPSNHHSQPRFDF